ncbi:hypothetical protein O6H91_10G048800 [Diphasiastrum complanatum]|uniref:Uncharacterized protein n=1 Tax=Diphasiastrum complanatum TaxID=34168 RepID=A0ACC2CGM7_DIPCM|nr:hypothetical protein O6H91_10G048800 [Diphasiastrum complanatum]
MARTPLVLRDGMAPGAGAGAGAEALPSRSSCVTETVNGSHDFTITGYSLAKGMGVGKYIFSDMFTVGGYQWAIYFYPDGKNAEDNSLYVSVFIALASEGQDVRALFELTLLDQSGKGKHKIHSHFDRSLEGGPYTLKYRGSMWGYKRFYRRAVLETSDYLKNDSLSIACTVGVVTSATQGPKLYSINIPEPELGQHFGALFDSGEEADVSFEVDGMIIKAHKLVLAARSPVFKAQLFGPIAEHGTNVLQIKEMDAPVFKALLQFIYKDKLPDADGFYGTSSASASTMMAQHLLAAADRYGLDRLRIVCEAKLCEDITVDTVATTLALAEQHNATQLKAVCLKFAAANLAAVMQSEGFEHLRENFPSLLSELLKTVAQVDEDGSRNRSAWGQFSDGTDVNGRRVRQRS